MRVSGRGIVIALISLVIIALGVGATVILVRQNQEIREKAAPSTSFSITPPTQNKNQGNAIEFTARMNTGSNEVTGVEVKLSYNKDVLEVTSVTSSSDLTAFTELATNGADNSTGRINFVAYLATADPGLKGAQDLFTVAGKIKDDAVPGKYKLDFLPESKASGTGEGQDVLTSKTAAEFSVISTIADAGGAGATATATATATSTARATATATGTGLGGLNATASPSPTGTSTKSPSPTARATGTATSSPSELPASGLSLPTAIMISAGILAIIITFILAI